MNDHPITYVSDDGSREVRLVRPLASSHLDLQLWHLVRVARVNDPIDEQLRSQVARHLLAGDRVDGILTDHFQPRSTAEAPNADDEELECYFNGDRTLAVVVTDLGHRTQFDLYDQTGAGVHLYNVELDHIADAPERSAQALAMMYPRRPELARELGDERVLDIIAATLRQAGGISGADFLQEVEQLVIRSGRDTTTPGDPLLWEA